MTVWEPRFAPDTLIVMKGDTQGRTQQQLQTDKAASMYLVYISCLVEITFSVEHHAVCRDT